MRIAIAVFATLLFVPELASACAACGFGEDESRIAYIGTTAFLSFLPMILIGAAVLWFWWQPRKTARATAEAEPTVVPIRASDRRR